MVTWKQLGVPQGVVDEVKEAVDAGIKVEDPPPELVESVLASLARDRKEWEAKKMSELLEKLDWQTFRALRGRPDNDSWPLRKGESWIDRDKLLNEGVQKWGGVLEFLRGEKVPRMLANRVLACHNIPIAIPAGAMEALGLNGPEKETEDGVWHAATHIDDGSPLDYPVFWDQGEDGRYCWRRTDLPVYAAQDDDGLWATGSATY